MSALDKTHESDEKIDVTPGKIVDFVKDAYARGVDKIEKHPLDAAKDALAVAAAVGVGAAVTYVTHGNSVRIGKLASSIGLERAGNFFERFANFGRADRAATFAEHTGFYKASARPGVAFRFGDKEQFTRLDRNGSEFQEIIGAKLNLDLQKLDAGHMAILHPRFKYPEKQLFGKVDERRDLSLWGDKAQGVGVVEYKDLDQRSGLFAGAKSVVRVTSRTDEAQAESFANSGASGVFIGRPDQRLVLTNEHVVRNSQSLHVETTAGNRFAARTVLTNPERDLAVIQLTDAPPAMLFPVASLSNRSFVAAGEKMAAIGHHGVLKGLIASPGHYQRYNPLASFDFLSLDSATPGSSGGPVFDKAGDVVSLVRGELRNIEKVDRAMVAGINVEHMRVFMKQVDALLADAKHFVAEDVSKFERFKGENANADG